MKKVTKSEAPSTDLTEEQLAQLLADKKTEKVKNFIEEYNAICLKYGVHIEHNIVLNYGQPPQKQVVVADN